MRTYVKHAAPAAPEAGPNVRSAVEEIIADVRARGDAAVRAHSVRLDDWAPERFRLSETEIERSLSRVDGRTLADIREVQDNVRRFARRQRASLADFEEETADGVLLGQRSIPVEAVGAYVPGGRYPLLASAHMTIIPAKVAGVRRVVACTPPGRGDDRPDASVAAMHLAGADEIHLLGGVQAVAAMALGAGEIAPVDMLVGPGNAYVAEAKRMLFGEVGMDLFAGPTEVLIIADDAADPFTVAVDLLSQAEHGPDSPAVLVTTSAELAERTVREVDACLAALPTRDIAGPAWRDHGQVIVVGDLDEAYAVSDEFASEHVQVLTREPRRALERLRNYGSLFLGRRTCVSFGDKVIGTNHVLPTRGAARYTGGLWVGMYLKTVTYQQVTSDAASAHLGALCGRAARAERFEGHARSADLRTLPPGHRPAWA